jgi:diguanylate cyclase (GGDEF)-like protein
MPRTRLRCGRVRTFPFETRTAFSAMPTLNAVLNRFRNRPDSEHEQAVVRIGVLYLYAAAFATYGFVSGHWYTGSVVSATLHMLLAPAALVWIYFRPGISHPRRLFFTVMDRLVIACQLIQNDAFMQTAYPLLLWVDVGNGARFGRRYHIISTAISTGLWAIVLHSNPFWQSPTMAKFGYGLLAGIMFLPFYARLFHRRLEEANSRLSATCEQITQLATHDPLTGLANRSHLYRRLNEALSAAQRHQRRLAILYIDLDNFKDINDRTGHHAGDKALCAAADVFRQQTRRSDTIARVGGDEFIVVLSEVSTDRLVHVGEALCAALAAHPLALSASVGIAVFPECGTTIDELIHSADAAMYRAKQAGRNRCVTAEPGPASSSELACG